MRNWWEGVLKHFASVHKGCKGGLKHSVSVYKGVKVISNTMQGCARVEK